MGKLNIFKKYRELPIQVRASFWFLICSFLQKGISSITTPIFTRLLNTAEYGQFNVFNSWLGIASIFITMSLSGGVYTQGLIKFDKERYTFSSSLQGLVLTLTCIWTVIYLIFHDFWNNLFSLTTVQMLALLIMAWTSEVFCFWAAEQRVRLNYVKLVIVTLIVSVAKPVIGIIFVINAEDKVTARILGLALVELIGYSGLFISQMLRGKKFFSARYWKYAIMFNLPLIPHYLSQTVLSSSDRIMIKNMVGESEAGIYSLAYSVSLIMTLFNTALGYTLSPWIYQKIKENKIKDIEPISYISLAVIAFANIMLIAFAPEVILIFAPKSYYEAIWVIPPIAMSVYFMFAYDLFSKFEFYYEKTKFIMLASLIASVTNVILNYIFINLFGYMAAGYTTLLCYFLYALFHFIFMRRICKKQSESMTPFNLKTVAGITGVFITVGFIYILTYKITIARYIISLAIVSLTIVKWRKIFELIRKTYINKNIK